MKKLCGILGFLFLGTALFGQSRDDITVYVAPTTGGSPEDQSFFDENFKMEVMGANYLVMDQERGADYTIRCSITEEEDWDDPYAMVNIINISLFDNSDGHEVVQFSWEYREIEEMYEWNLHLIYQAMANVPLTKLTAVPDTNHWRNKWLYLSLAGYANLQFGFFDKSLMSEDEQKQRGPYTFYFSPAVGITLEFQFLNFMSAEAGLVGFMQNYGGDNMSGMSFGLPVLLKFPLKPSKHFMLEPYGGVQFNVSAIRAIRPPLMSWAAGFQFGVRAGERGAVFVDIRATAGIPGVGDHAAVNNGADWIELDPFELYFGFGFKIGFYNRNKEDVGP